MTETSILVAFLASSEAQARRVASALEAEGIVVTLAPATGYHGLEPERVEVRVGAAKAARARVIAIAAAAGAPGGGPAA